MTEKLDENRLKDMEDEITMEIEEEFKKESEVRKALIDKFPPNPPNEVCKHAFLKGLSIEDFTKPTVNEYIPFFEVPYEKIYVWNYKGNIHLGLISEVSPAVKEQVFWKSVGNVLQLSLAFYEDFESSGFDLEIDYKWINYYNPNNLIDQEIFFNIDESELHSISNARIMHVSQIALMAGVIELLIRDDKAFTSLALLNSSFRMSPCCLICELSEHPWHDHLIGEPQIWEQGIILPKMEAATVQACRCVEGILGEPPKRSKQGKVFEFKTKFNEMLGIDADKIFTKGNKSYLDFYYDLFFELRNPSAHNYGNVHFDLERKKVIEAQCFATIILNAYFKKNMLENDEAKKLLKFNKKLLNRDSSWKLE